MLNSFRQPWRRRGSGPDGRALERGRRGARDRPTSRSRRGYISVGRGREEHVDACVRGHRGVARLVARVVLEILRSPNCAGFTKRLTTTVSTRAARPRRARRARMKRAHRRHESDRARRDARARTGPRPRFSATPCLKDSPLRIRVRVPAQPHVILSAVRWLPTRSRPPLWNPAGVARRPRRRRNRDPRRMVGRAGRVSRRSSSFRA